MNWYLTKIVYRIICGQGNHMAQFDEQLRLIQAGSSEEAFEKSIVLGQKEEDKFYNEDQKLDLSVRTYQVTQESGDWLVCGTR